MNDMQEQIFRVPWRIVNLISNILIVLVLGALLALGLWIVIPFLLLAIAALVWAVFMYRYSLTLKNGKLIEHSPLGDRTLALSEVQQIKGGWYMNASRSGFIVFSYAPMLVNPHYEKFPRHGLRGSMAIKLKEMNPKIVIDENFIPYTQKTFFED